MIAYLKGQVLNRSVLPKKDGFLVLNVNGVGYKVFVLNKTLEKISPGQELELHIYTQVAEGVLDLYGFAAAEELNFFELLISLSGIGPRSALDILQKAKIEDIRQAVISGSHGVLSKVSGLGPKTAEKIVIGLKDKIGGLSSEVGGVWNNGDSDALDALTALGYSPAEAKNALDAVPATETDEKIKAALKFLAKR